jgi:hypothetical protein
MRRPRCSLNNNNPSSFHYRSRPSRQLRSSNRNQRNKYRTNWRCWNDDFA